MQIEQENSCSAGTRNHSSTAEAKPTELSVFHFVAEEGRRNSGPAVQIEGTGFMPDPRICVARGLHDSISPLLAALNSQLMRVRKSHFEFEPDGLRDVLGELDTILAELDQDAIALEETAARKG